MCNFFTYIRYIQQGLVRQDGERPLVAIGGGARGGGAGRGGANPGAWPPIPGPSYFFLLRNLSLGARGASVLVSGIQDLT